MRLLDKWFKRDRTPANPRLDQLMSELAQANTDERRAEFYRELLKSKLLLATPGLAGQGLSDQRSMTPDEPIAVRFIAHTDSDGKPAMLVFSGEAGLLAWRPVGCDYIIMPVAELFPLALRSGMNSIFINPNGPSGGMIPHWDLVALAEGCVPRPRKEAVTPHSIAESTSICIERPTTSPSQALIEMVRAQAEQCSAVLAAYVVQGTIGKGQPHLIIALELVPGAAPDQIIPGMAQALQAVLAKDEYVDFLPLGCNRSLDASIRGAGPPVFARS